MKFSRSVGMARAWVLSELGFGTSIALGGDAKNQEGWVVA